LYATDDLRSEHEGIKIALAVLEHLANEIQAGREVNLDDVEQLVDFLQTFADRCHHGKEEDLLFPALEKAGVPREGGPVGVMLSEHTHGREFIQTMNNALPGLRRNDAGAKSAFVKAAHGYVQLLSDHIEKENNVLFDLAERHLPSETHAQLSEGFEKIEQERIGPGVHERYHAMLDRLQDEYLTSPSKTK
jgi:hemerythrin-like domain-containing protein